MSTFLWYLSIPFRLIHEIFKNRIRYIHLDGVNWVPISKLRKLLRGVRPDKDAPPGWLATFGCVKASLTYWRRNRLTVGVPGTGKSLLQALAKTDVYPVIGTGLGWRALVADVNRHEYPLAHALLPKHVPIEILLATDSRSVALNLAKEFPDSASVQQYVNMMIPEVKGETDPFWRNQARARLHDLIDCLNILLPGTWQKRDVIELLRTVPRLKSIYSKVPSKHHAIDQMDIEKVSVGILATIQGELAKWEVIAAAWYHAKRSVTIDDFINGESVWLLGHLEKYGAVLEILNGFIVRRFCEAMLSRDTGTPTWLMLDEFALLKGVSVTDLANKGRNVGIILDVCTQDILLIDHALGDKDVSHAFLGLLGNRCYMTLGSNECAEHASKDIGEHRVLEQWADHRQVKIEPLVPPEKLKALPLCDYHGDLISSYMRTEFGPFRNNFHFRKLLPDLSKSSEKGYIERCVSELTLPPYTQADWDRLGIKCPDDPKNPD